jgi:hypothetical protein
MLLRPLGVSDEKQALQAHEDEELAQDDFEFLFGLEQGAPWRSPMSGMACVVQ